MFETFVTLVAKTNPWYGVLLVVAAGGYLVGQRSQADHEREARLASQIQDVRIQVEILRVSVDSENARLSTFICHGRPRYLCQ